MDLNVLLAIAGGLATGLITGLIPGIHVNIVAAIMVAMSSSLFQIGISPIAVAVYISATAIAHCFFDYVPSLFLGVPNDEVFSLLPGHQMVKGGKGLEALNLSVAGSWGGLVLGAIFLVLFAAFDQVLSLNIAANALMRLALFWILLIISLVLIFSEENRIWSAVVFLLSGIFGVVVLGSPLIPGGEQGAFSALFPALAGIFGVSGLILSLLDNGTKLPPQDELTPGASTHYGAIGRGTVAGMAVGLLPGLGGANAATLLLLVENWLGKKRGIDDSERQYIVTTSAINTADTLFGIVALYLIDKARSGASVAIAQMLEGQITLSMLAAIGGGMLVAGYCSRSIINRCGLLIVSGITRFHYKGLTVSVIAFITVLVAMTAGVWGLIILLGGVLLGLIAPLSGVRRAQAMGFFLIPVTLFYSGKQREVASFLHLESQASPPQPLLVESLLVYMAVAIVAAFISYYVASRKAFSRNTA